MDHVLSELSTMTHPSWVALHGLAYSFIELDKAVLHVSVWLVFCDCGFHSVCPLMDKDQSLWKLPDGKDWLWRNLGLVLTQVEPGSLQWPAGPHCPVPGAPPAPPHPILSPLPRGQRPSLNPEPCSRHWASVSLITVWSPPVPVLPTCSACFRALRTQRASQLASYLHPVMMLGGSKDRWC